ncbi:AMP-dependent synthetase [Brasilonema octagenarum UFV-E1]|uniref:AMP-dependent synthetase n=2 Tax=Brasilonema TaxID=383614 RepID=A0A856MH15_9CYAN|nr:MULTISPECIES: AMP-binding protein [Brasilonema]NMF65577.1 AMP-dependent synthetase [Brasilonema octagenarum UFV-OR1]QDL09530.1 AMP-dependent synthetase [Brasilonema sennae CENA114]QDL15886.1 AMP-dependent synthetase [Brasilonema octagenarum UFV-E1]
MYHDLFSADSPQEATLVNLLRYRAQQQPNHVPYTFLVDGETEKLSFTYETLDQKARAIGALLQSMEAFGERVLLLYPPGLEFIAAFFGGLYAGVTVVPVYPPRGKQRMTRLQAIAKDAQATFALTTSSVMTQLGERFKEESELAALQCIATDNIAENLANDWYFPEINNDSLALLQYTSGTTGNPKGVMVNHDNLLYNSALIYQAFEHTPDSRGVIWLPPYHDMGLIGGVLQPVYGSCSVTLMSPESFLQKPFRWLKAISDYQATTSGGPNFAYDLCVDKITPEQRQQLDLSSWEVAFNGAEPVRAETIEKFSATFADCGFKRSAFYPCYGMAETTLIVSGGLKKEPPVIRFVQDKAFKQNLIVTTTSKDEDARAIVGVGHSSLDQKIVIVHPESLTRCLDGQIGEIWVAGPSVAGGYWNKPEETQQTFNAQLQNTKEGPFLRTGDLGFLLNGELFVTGRLKDMMIIRGQNHYPQDIEFTVENSHPALRANCGAAFSVEIDGVEQLVITQEIERTYLRQLDVDQVVKSIRQAVSEQHQLQVYAIVLLKTASIPKTSSGKVQRHACRVGFLDKSLDVVGDWTANLTETDLQQLQAEVDNLWEQVHSSDVNSDINKSETEQKSFKPTLTEKEIQTWLISHLALYLNIPPDEIDIQEPFTAYGLDSAVAVSMTGELGQWIGCELAIILFWEYPSIEILAQYLAEEYNSLSSSKSPASV